MPSVLKTQERRGARKQLHNVDGNRDAYSLATFQKKTCTTHTNACIFHSKTQGPAFLHILVLSFSMSLRAQTLCQGQRSIPQTPQPLHAHTLVVT